MAYSDCEKIVLDWVVKQGDSMALDRLLTCIMSSAAILRVSLTTSYYTTSNQEENTSRQNMDFIRRLERDMKHEMPWYLV